MQESFNLQLSIQPKKNKPSVKPVKAKSSSKLTPMLTQYIEFKEEHSDCIVLIQVGDFYEAFFDDAKTLASTLNVTLTSRSKKDSEPIPMAGVPIGAVEGYLDRLVDAGYSVVLVSQQESFAGKGMVPRFVDRIITPGVRLLGHSASVENVANYVCAVQLEKLDFSSDVYDVSFALAFSDFQTGEVFLKEGNGYQQLNSEIRRLMPAELLIPRTVNGIKLDQRQTWIRELGKFSKALKFRAEAKEMKSYKKIKGFEKLAPIEKKALGILTDFLEETLVTDELPIHSIERFSDDDVLWIDSSTRDNLDLIKNSNTRAKDLSLFGVLDKTKTFGGSRLLQDWILSPSFKIEEIKARQNVVAFLKEDPFLLEKVRESLATVSNLERISARIELGVITPRELGALRDSLENVPKIKELFFDCEEVPELLANVIANLRIDEDLFEILVNSLEKDLPLSVKNGSIFVTGYNPQLDELRKLKEGGSEYILNLELEEKQKTGISSLKIKYNNVLGYFFDVTKANVSKVPSYFIPKQKTTNSERFFTDELKATEQKVIGAKTKILSLERELFEEYRQNLKTYSESIRKLSKQISILDVLADFAYLADSEGYVCPQIEESEGIDIVEGKHPILSRMLGSEFISNNLKINEQSKLIIITGANMGGKSTYLRQTALLVIMAQIGSFIPAQSAKIGLVDKIFARIGASDDISEGESTFMVEMREASGIISGATNRSLVLIDEIGRGTATRDGLAIAQAVLEWLVKKTKCRTLFATHFHELTNLSNEYEQVKNLSVSSIDREGKVIFTHKMQSGPASQSYGIEVAKLAGLPGSLLERAEELLESIDNNEVETKNQIDLF